MNPKAEELRSAVQELANQYGMNVETESMYGCVMHRLVLPRGENGNGIGGYYGNVVWDEEAKAFRTFHYNGTKYKSLRGVMKAFAEWLKNTVETRKKEEADRVTRATAIERICTIAGKKFNDRHNDSVMVTTKKYGFDLELTPNSAGRVYIKMRFSASIPVDQLSELLGIM